MGRQAFSSSEADQRAEDGMQAVLDRYLPGRKPASIDDYEWQAIRPDVVDQDMLGAMNFVTLVECNPEAPAGNLLAPPYAGAVRRLAWLALRTRERGRACPWGV